MRDLPAPDVPQAATTTTSVGSTSPAARPGASARVHGRRGSSRGRRSAALREHFPLLPAGRHELGQPVGPGAGVLGAVEVAPGSGVGQPEVRAAVDHQDVVGQLGGERAGRAVRQGEDDDVVTGQRVRRVVSRIAVGERRQVRV